MAQVAAATLPQTLVLGRYRPLRPLGSGGSGSVWLARDERSGRDVALKIVPREGTAGSRAEREAITAARLRHPRCLRAFTLARDVEHVYIAYEHVPGRTLRQALRNGELGDRGALEAAAQILDGLAHAHSHDIVHRDVKPANVLLEDGGEISVKLLDFGLALMREEDTLTAVGDIPGTLAYISPERLRGEVAGPAADVWSVGVLLFEALAGEHPFWQGTLLDTARSIQSGAPSLTTRRPDLPREVIRVVDRALSVDPAKRPSASRLASEVRRSSAVPRRRHSRKLVRVPHVRLEPGRLLHVAAAGLFAGWAAFALPFYGAGWPFVLTFLAAGLAAVSPRAGLALALAVPVFPLGNHALGLALVYSAVAAGWFVLSWREPRSGLLLALGPLLSPLGLVGLLPLAGQVVHSSSRRLAQVTAAVLATGAVSDISHLGLLGITGTDSPLRAGAALSRALSSHGSLPVEAIALGVAAVALPYARARGRFAIAAYGVGTLAATLFLAPSVPALPLIVTTWVTCALLALEPVIRKQVPSPRVSHAKAAREAQEGHTEAAPEPA